MAETVGLVTEFRRDGKPSEALTERSYRLPKVRNWRMTPDNRRAAQLKGRYYSFRTMTPAAVRDLRACSPAIRVHWEALLRLERVNTPLANPDTLAHLIPHSLEEIFLQLGKYSRVPVSISAARAQLPACTCGNNPYRAYFIAGEQAVTEAFVLLQANLPAMSRRSSDLAEVIFAVRRLARSNIEAFCGVCVNRGSAPRCRHTAQRGMV